MCEREQPCRVPDTSSFSSIPASKAHILYGSEEEVRALGFLASVSKHNMTNEDASSSSKMANGDLVSNWLVHTPKVAANRRGKV